MASLRCCAAAALALTLLSVPPPTPLAAWAPTSLLLCPDSHSGSAAGGQRGWTLGGEGRGGEGRGDREEEGKLGFCSTLGPALGGKGGGSKHGIDCVCTSDLCTRIGDDLSLAVPLNDAWIRRAAPGRRCSGFECLGDQGTCM